MRRWPWAAWSRYPRGRGAPRQRTGDVAIGEGRDTLRQVATARLEGFLVAGPVPRPANVLDLPPVTITERGHRGYHRRA